MSASLTLISAFFRKPFLAQVKCVGADAFGLYQQPVRLPRGVEDSLLRLNLDRTGVTAFRVSANNLHSGRVENYDLVFIDPYRDLAVYPGGQSGIETVSDNDCAVVMDFSGFLLEICEGLQRQRPQIRFFLLKHGLHLAFGPTVDSRRCPAFLPVSQPFVLRLYGLEFSSLQDSILGMFDRVLDGSLRNARPEYFKVMTNNRGRLYLPLSLSVNTPWP